MIDYNSDLTIIKRLVENSESKLFPRMKKRKEYLESLTEENKEVPPALKAEIELNDQMRQHIQLLMNQSIFLQKFIERNLITEKPQENNYIKVLENELLHEFRSKHNIVK